MAAKRADGAWIGRTFAGLCDIEHSAADSILSCMFGNRLGWGISALIVIVVAMMLGVLDWYARHVRQAAQTKKDTEQKVENVEAKYKTSIGWNARDWSAKLAIDPRQVASAWMTQEGEAMPLYKQALAVYKERPLTFENFKSDQVGSLPTVYREQIDRAMKLLIEASKLKGGGIFRDETAKLIGYDIASDEVACDLAALKAMRDLGTVAGNYAWFYRHRSTEADRYQRADELQKASFSLGLKLYEERIGCRELIAGMGLMAVAEDMARQTEDPAQKELLTKFAKARLEYAQTDLPKLWAGAMWTLDPNVYDMMALARDCRETMWRVEAILTLGRAKFRCDPAKTNAMHEQAKRQAVQAIKFYLDDSNPSIREAARKADLLTIVDWQKMNLESGNPFDF